MLFYNQKSAYVLRISDWSSDVFSSDLFIALMICGAGLPLPEDITLVAGGVIAGLGYANVHTMVALAMFGVLLGDSAIFMLGHHYGARILQWRFVARVLTPARYAKVQEKFDQ